ncbi:hypothetical protein HK096_005726, partial [Nowakowskiella sp. JEL0078]
MPSPSLSNTGMAVDPNDRSLFFGFVSLAAAFIGSLLILLPILLYIRKKNHRELEKVDFDLKNNPSTQSTSIHSSQNIESFRDFDGTYRVPENPTTFPGSEIGSPAGIGNAGMFKTMKVVYEYVPQLQDELRLNFGDIVLVTHIYDDGWAAGNNLVTGEIGAFPFMAVGVVEDDLKYKGKSVVRTNSRVSSLTNSSYEKR